MKKLLASTESNAKVITGMVEIIERANKAIVDAMERSNHGDGYQVIDPVLMTKTLGDVMLRWFADPAGSINHQTTLWSNMSLLYQRSFARMLLNRDIEPVIQPASDDKRFKGEIWKENATFDFIKQAYLLVGEYLTSAVRSTEGLDPATARRANFYTRQIVGALAPTNFPNLNPAVIKATVESGGENLIDGVRNLLADIERGKGRIDLRMTDTTKFSLGENIATTPGKVVAENDILQLIQYRPSTEKVRKTPLLIVPPWINKFYILDLNQKNSLVKWATEMGHTVFVISWVNPNQSLSRKDFVDYMKEGFLFALQSALERTKQKKANVVGYCIGGTLTAASLGYMAAKKDKRVKSATFLTTLTDFSNVGDVEAFIDDDQLSLMEAHMDRLGFLDGKHMANAFNLLRENDLIWSFAINNYLLGKEPLPFDILFWNSDSTRMPAAMHRYYLRNMYQKNLLREPAGLTLDGVPIDLRAIDVPAYFLSTKEDHIAPWRSTYAGAKLLSGPVRFVLGASGHVAGVINPASANKYPHWTNESLPQEPDVWFDGAVSHQKSWWNDWDSWVSQYAGGYTPARHLTDLEEAENAPGRYVLEK